MRVRVIRSFVVLAFASLASVAQAGVVSLASDSADSTSNLGSFTGSFQYDFANATQGTIKITIANTSPVANGGYITGIAFNNPGNLITGVSLTTNTGLTTLLGGSGFNNSVAANPFGSFDVAASLNGSFNGSGSPLAGIDVGETGNFTFNLTGTNLNTLTVNSFANAFNSGANSNYSGEFFLARFRGFCNEGSDKVPSLPPPTIQVNPVPEPASLALWGLGGLGLATFFRRRRAERKA